MRGCAGVWPVLLGPDAAGSKAERSGRDDQRPVAAREDGADGLDGQQVGPRRLFHPGEVVVVAEVDDAVAGGRAGAQAVEVVQIAAQNLGAKAGNGRRRGIGPGEAHQLLSGSDQLADNR